ncbi:phage portal protein [Citreimonas sp.]|uniref:phage portal protein n=1 Tax=Citreimonas sp. TaxID=3036715 RepID=UPI0040590B12
MTAPNFIDRAIGYFAPRVGADRMRHRATMSAMQHYDAAGGGKRAKTYKAPSGDANAAVRGGRRLRLVSRDMVRNNAIARRAVAALVDNIVGDGIIPSIDAESDADERRLQEIINAHLDTTAVDAVGRLDLYGLQRMAVEGMITGGEVLWRRRPRFATDRVARLPFQVESLEPEYLDDRHLGRLASGNVEYDGIEFDALRRRVAYRLFEEHPEDILTGFPASQRITAQNIIHLYRMERPGQRRGITWLAPVIPLISDAYDYADAQLVRQKIAAMWVAFTRDTEAEVSDEGVDYDLTLTPGMFEHLPPGRDVQFSDPPKVDGYADHMKQVQRMIAAALSITYEELSGDLEGVNFSSARIGRMAMQKAVSSAQWTTVIPSLCHPLETWIRDALAVTPDAPKVEFSFKWTPPRFAMTDPAREVPAALAEIEGGLTSRQRKIREMGYDPEEIYREIAQDKAAAEAAGVSFASAPARIENGQNGQDDAGE